MRCDQVAHDPTDGLDLPSVRAMRDRIEPRERAAALIHALPEAERAHWALGLASFAASSASTC
jgi:hypothetical protein